MLGWMQNGQSCHRYLFLRGLRVHASAHGMPIQLTVAVRSETDGSGSFPASSDVVIVSRKENGGVCALSAHRFCSKKSCTYSGSVGPLSVGPLRQRDYSRYFDSSLMAPTSASQRPQVWPWRTARSACRAWSNLGQLFNFLCWATHRHPLLTPLLILILHFSAYM
jgi:hypothetical protein